MSGRIAISSGTEDLTSVSAEALGLHWKEMDLTKLILACSMPRVRSRAALTRRQRP